jgi:hypothetical protein
MAQATGAAAYARQAEQYTLWTEAAAARPVRSMARDATGGRSAAALWATPASGSPSRTTSAPAKGTLLDLRL